MNRIVRLDKHNNTLKQKSDFAFLAYCAWLTIHSSWVCTYEGADGRCLIFLKLPELSAVPIIVRINAAQV